MRIGEHVDGAVVVVDHVVGARLQRRFHDAVLVAARGKADLSHLGEQVGHGSVGAQIAAVLGEGVAHVGHGAVAVVGHALDHHRDAAGPVALVAHLFDLLA